MSKKKTTTVIYTNYNGIKALIHSIKDGVMFGITYKRRTPKCPGCGRSLKSFIGKTHCHFCGSELSFERVTCAQKGVVNPGNPSVTKPGKGKIAGLSAAEAERLYDLFKHYDVNAEDGKGDYRSCGFTEIKSVRYDKKEYIVI